MDLEVPWFECSEDLHRSNEVQDSETREQANGESECLGSGGHCGRVSSKDERWGLDI